MPRLKSNDIKAAIRKRQKKKGLKKPPAWLHPYALEREYGGTLKKLVVELSTMVRGELIPYLDVAEIGVSILHPDARQDGWSDEISSLFASVRFRMGVKSEEIEPLIRGIANKASTFNDKQLKKIVGNVLGVDVLKSEPWINDQLDSFVNENVKLIKSIPEKYLDDVEGIVQRGFRGGVSKKDIAKEMRSRLGVTKRRAELIARDQVKNLNKELTRLRQKEIGVKQYVWRTSGDERVRSAHAQHDGKTYSWDNPPENTGNPGDDINCRCYAEPVLESLL